MKTSIKNIKLIYIAGPFTAENSYQRELNIRAAESVALDLATHTGDSALCPHTQSRYFFGTLPEQYWLDATMRQMLACDAVVLVDGWELSSGTINEVKQAFKSGIPVYTNVDSYINNSGLFQIGDIKSNEK